MRSRLRAVSGVRAVSRFGLAAVALLLTLSFVPAVSAHDEIEVGDGEYHVNVGWLNEPAFVGLPNAVEVLVTTHDGDPITDLAAGDLTVIVSTAGQDSVSLPLAPAFDLGEGFGTPGQYEVELVPTTPGEYTFHFGGRIRDVEVDVSVTSGEETFSPVVTSTDLEFPVKLPTLADVATRLDRIDGRIEALAAGNPGAEALEAAEAATEAANAAAAAADRAMLIGVAIGGAGLLLGAVALVIAARAGRRGAGAA